MKLHTLLEMLSDPASLYAVVVSLVLCAVPIGYGLKKARQALRNPANAKPSGLKLWQVGLLGWLGGAITWLAWLTWSPAPGSIFRTNPANQPYDTNQVVCCALTLVIVALAVGQSARYRVAGPFVAAAATLWGFHLLWSLDASSTDSTGLWGVGAVLLATGSGLALYAVAWVHSAIQITLHRRSQRPQNTP
ncbi:hypothetical protein GP475_10060 [Corynebacterium poyangense]|uniref:Uncharacterized protein n=1 Tax=Corynebacterium poyangense TaxID=2684405 RepID=A0A7H0SQV8_9CORY|nr:hypothetical protein [Corynebacterium poyangense]MBZ8176350.1 hypothetical protein [Corynebacterium poyangense]QNQ90933.1 hypothetical protein GP475_10060 [Corynebacterium poyangense]